MPQGFELREGKRFCRSYSGMSGEVSAQDPIIIHTVSQVCRKVCRDHKTHASVRVDSHPIPQHRETRILTEVSSEVMYILVIEQAGWNECKRAEHAEASGQPIFG